MTAPTPATPLCMAPACSRPAMHDGECGPAPMSGWEFQPDSRDTASTLPPAPRPDLRPEGGSPDGLGGRTWTTTRPDVATPGAPATTESDRLAGEIARLNRMIADLRAEVAVAEQRGAKKALSEAAEVLAYASDVWREDGGSPRHRFAYWEAARVIAAWAEKPSRMEGPLRGAKARGAQVPGPLDTYPPARAAAGPGPDTTTEGDPR